MALAATLDKSLYTEGDTITLTVTTAAGERVELAEFPFTVHVAVGSVGSVDAAGAVRKPTGEKVPVEVSDSDARTWAAGADDGLTAVFTATA